MLLVEQHNWIDPILMYHETHHQLGYRYFIMCQSITVTSSCTTRHMNTRIQYGRGKVNKRYVRDKVTIKMISALLDGTPTCCMM